MSNLYQPDDFLEFYSAVHANYRGMDAAKRGADALDADKPFEAIVHYTRALIERPASPEYHIQRSIAFTRVGKHEFALEDAEAAVHFGFERSKREAIQAGQQRRVVALYNLGRYGDAKHIHDGMQEWINLTEHNKEVMQYNIWRTKLTKKLETATDEQKTVTVEDRPDIRLPTEKARVDNLKRQIKSDGTYNFDWENETGPIVEPETTSEAVTEIPVTVTSGEPQPSKPISSVTPAGKIRHEWYQNNKFVFITIYAKGVSKEAAEFDFQDDSVAVSFPDPANPTNTFSISFDPLWALVFKSDTTYRILSTKIEITLHKATPGQKWRSIEGITPLKPRPADDADSSEAPAIRSIVYQYPEPPQETAPAYPTSSKSGPKNWDKVAADFSKKKHKANTKASRTSQDDSNDKDNDEDEMLINSDDDEGGDSVDSFFKKLYKDADDDTRRAMMKSFQESNGTALSTSWEDVKKKRVEVVESKND